MGVAAIASGWDTNLLTKFSFVNTSKAEARLISALGSEKFATLVVNAAEPQRVLADEGRKTASLSVSPPSLMGFRPVKITAATPMRTGQAWFKVIVSIS